VARSEGPNIAGSSSGFDSFPPLASSHNPSVAPPSEPSFPSAGIPSTLISLARPLGSFIVTSPIFGEFPMGPSFEPLNPNPPVNPPSWGPPQAHFDAGIRPSKKQRCVRPKAQEAFISFGEHI